MVVADEDENGRMERETSGQDAPACRPPPLFSLSTAGGRQAGKRRETTLMNGDHSARMNRQPQLELNGLLVGFVIAIFISVFTNIFSIPISKRETQD